MACKEFNVGRRHEKVVTCSHKTLSATLCGPASEHATSQRRQLCARPAAADAAQRPPVSSLQQTASPPRVLSAHTHRVLTAGEITRRPCGLQDPDARQTEEKMRVQ